MNGVGGIQQRAAKPGLGARQQLLVEIICTQDDFAALELLPKANLLAELPCLLQIIGQVKAEGAGTNVKARMREGVAVAGDRHDFGRAQTPSQFA